MNRLKLLVLLSVAFVLAGCKVSNDKLKDGVRQAHQSQIQQDRAPRAQETREGVNKNSLQPSIDQPVKMNYKGPKYAERAAYFKELYTKYGRNIRYESEIGRQMVKRFMFGCPHKDGRVLPFLHVLLLEMHQTDFYFGYNMRFSVSEKNGKVGVFVNVKRRDGQQVIPTDLSYEFNPEGKLRIVKGIHRQSINDACLGKHGNIWTYPDEEPFFQ